MQIREGAPQSVPNDGKSSSLIGDTLSKEASKMQMSDLDLNLLKVIFSTISDKCQAIFCSFPFSVSSLPCTWWRLWLLSFPQNYRTTQMVGLKPKFFWARPRLRNTLLCRIWQKTGSQERRQPSMQRTRLMWMKMGSLWQRRHVQPSKRQPRGRKKLRSRGQKLAWLLRCLANSPPLLQIRWVLRQNLMGCPFL